eukprot:scaffold897_cov402-Prasinococcus_capsulatus_cf.AAC.33
MTTCISLRVSPVRLPLSLSLLPLEFSLFSSCSSPKDCDCERLVASDSKDCAPWASGPSDSSSTDESRCSIDKRSVAFEPLPQREERDS